MNKNNEFYVHNNDPSGLAMTVDFSTSWATIKILKRMTFCHEISYAYVICGF
jgi:hypothetical protein